MVKVMNKKEFINELSRQLSYSLDQCVLINDILEGNFFISKKNKDKIIDEFIQVLHVNEEEAIRIYEVAVQIIQDEVKRSLKHPFKSKD